MPTSARWRRALDGVTILEAPSAEDEAEAVALILREVAETPGRTAALVTPDRTLARRVAVRLQAWGVTADDFGDTPFPATPVGAFLDLIVEAAARRFEPVALVSLLKHSLCRLGLPAEEYGHGLRALELAAFRAPYFGQGLEGVAAALERAQADLRAGKRRHGGVSRLKSDDWQAARQAREGAGAGVATARSIVPVAGQGRAFRDRRHACQSRRGPGRPRQRGAGRQRVAGQSRRGGRQVLCHAARCRYARALHGGGRLRGVLPRHRRRRDDRSARRRPIRALPSGSPTSSRLQQPDIVILGSLNEGTWPRAADPGPWLNRQMQAELGLPAPEERIGDAAHIFTSLLGTPEVYLTRAAKVGGVPNVPSRWLLRLQALLAGLRTPAPAAGKPWLAWAQARNALDVPARPVKAPEPRPALELRPRRLSVTAIEKWIANPYAIYRRAHPAAGGAAAARPPARRGAARPDRARRTWPFCRPLPAGAAGRHLRRARGPCGAWPDGADRLAAGRSLLGAALCPLRGLVRRDGTCAPHRRRAQPRGAGGQPRARERRQAVHAHRPRRPHRRRQARGSSSPTTRPAATSRTSVAAPRRARRRSCRSRRRSRSPEGSPACPRAQSRRCATSRAPAASRRAWSTPSRTATWQLSPAAHAKGWSG